MFATLLLVLLLGDPARLAFTKSFPGSMPDYYRIVLTEDATALYFEAADDPHPREFRITEDFARKVFGLAANLEYFKGPVLETKKKLANMGRKTLLYESGAQRGEQSFNYSELPDAQALTEQMEKLSATQQHIITLERQMRYDKLGLMKQLLFIDSAVRSNSLAEPQLLMPILAEISTNKTFLGIAQQRAKIILAKLEPPASK